MLVTGGTFDKQYDGITGTLFFRETHLPEMLRLGRCCVPVTLETVMWMITPQLTEHTGRSIASRWSRRA